VTAVAERVSQQGCFLNDDDYLVQSRELMFDRPCVAGRGVESDPTKDGLATLA
jgi:hypothetical protein